MFRPVDGPKSTGVDTNDQRERLPALRAGKVVSASRGRASADLCEMHVAILHENTALPLFLQLRGCWQERLRR
jgi:hypothetical protein